MLLTVILIIMSFPLPTHSFISVLKTSVLQILPTVAFLFFFGTDSADSPDCLPILLSISISYFLVFLFSIFYLSVPCGRLSRLMSAFECTLKQHLVSYRIVSYSIGNGQPKKPALCQAVSSSSSSSP